MKQQTAVEWLFEQMLDDKLDNRYELLQQAKQMEMEQIVDAANLPKDRRWYNAEKYNNCGEQYYNETYSK